MSASSHAAAPLGGLDRSGLRPRLTEAFAAPSPPTVGLEEEVMLVDPATWDLLPRAAEVIARAGQRWVKDELPAAQVELLTPPCDSVGAAAAALGDARRLAAAAAEGVGVLAAAGLHPFTAGEGVITAHPRTAALAAEYGSVVRRQLVFGLHVHVAIRSAGRAVGVYNALREHLPDLAALAANAPFHDGADTGLASARPLVAGLLPRQGIPPALGSLQDYAEALAWGLRAGVMQDARQWWWELRPHPAFGTLEVRVADAQPTVDEAAAVAAVVQALAVHLAARHDAGDLPPPAPGWRIAENRWSACRHGVDGVMVDVRSGVRTATRERLAGLLDDLAPTAALLACAGELAGARSLLEDPAPARHRAIAAGEGQVGLVRWLAGRFIAPPGG